MQFLAPLIALSLFAAEVRDVALTAAVPEPGAARRIACRVTTKLAGDTLEVEMDGAPVPPQYLPRLDFSMDDERSFVAVDVHDADGWVRELESAGWRNEGAMEVDSGGSVESYPWTSDARTPLEGRKVRFDRGEEDARAVGFADGRDGDVAKLAGLRAELGLVELLPAEPASPMAIGAMWTISGDALDAVFDPGGDLAFDLDPEAEQYLRREERSRSYSGELTLRLASVEDGVARCDAEGEIVCAVVRDGDLSQVPVADGTATETVTSTWDATGTLTWLVEERRLEGLDLAGALREESLTVRDAGQPGPTYRSVFHMAGERELRVVCEALEPDAAR